MRSEEYEVYVAQQCKDYVTPTYCAVALNEDAGEVAGFWKKYHFRGNPNGKLFEIDLLYELGDVLFYLTRMANLHGWSVEDVMDANKAKLDAKAKRHL